jgi:two-component system, OmpR family, sensor histidine kinase CpxA
MISDDNNGATRAFFPLYGKMILCLVLNILLVGLVGFWLLRLHFGLGEGWLLSDAARGRIQAMSTVLTAELREAPPDAWTEIVNRTGQTHRVRLTLFDLNGRQVAGAPTELPAAVAERFTRPGGPPGRAFPPPRAGGQEGPRLRQQPGPRWAEPPEAPGPWNDPTEFPKEALRAGEPPGYWFIVRLPLAQRPPLVAVGRADRLGETGLFFDPAPWAWAAAGIFFGSVLLWFPLARGVTRAVGEMTRATEEIARGRFDVRVKEGRRDELGRLGAAINRMTGRLGGFVSGQKRFLGDVAHELCSPLARMEMGLAVLERKLPPSERERLEDVREEVGEMRALVSELLDFSRAGLASEQRKLEPAPLAKVVRAALEREAGGVQVDCEVAEGLWVRAHPALLQRAVSNVVCNAVQHAGATGLALRAWVEGNQVVLRIADGGPGVPPEALTHLFEPFYRVDDSRSRDTGGAGLGLAIVRTAVAACEGEVLARNLEGGGFEVEFHLVATDPA